PVSPETGAPQNGAKTVAPGTENTATLDPVAVTTDENITFVNTQKSASTLAIGRDGSVFGLDAAGNILRWSNTRKRFESFPGTLIRIAVDAQGNPWGISTLGRVFRHT
ncbi:MAG: tectonin domain-containing protein, partial [Pseudomonadales bacterium]